MPASRISCGQLRRVAEHVGLPQLRAAAARGAARTSAGRRGAGAPATRRREVAVGLHPRPADRDPLPAPDRLPHAGEQLRRPLAQPLVVLRLRVGEAMLGILVEQPQLRGDRADELAPRLLERPQPRRVEVRVPDRRHAVQLARRPLEQPREPRAVAVERERVQLGQEAARPTPARRPASSSSAAQHLEVVPERPRLRVEARDLAAHAAANVAAAPCPASPKPNGSLHASSSSNGTRSPPAARSSERRVRPHLARRRSSAPAAGRPSEPQRRLAARAEQQIDRAPAQPPGIAAVPRSQ